MPGLLLGFLLATASPAFLEASSLPPSTAYCPLDLSWANYILIASACSDQNERTKCCRYINALVAVSVARYANTTGTLGVPLPFSDGCLSTIYDILISNRIPPSAVSFCGLRVKIPVIYQCAGRSTVVDMLQSPNFDGVIRSCNMPLSVNSDCKRCLNSVLSYLRHLVGAPDNVTLNGCRDAAFVALANQRNTQSPFDIASCFFQVQGLSVLQETSSPFVAPATSPSPLSAQAPAEHLHGTPDHHNYQISWIPGVGIVITALAILLLIILIRRTQRKNKQLKRNIGIHNEDSQNVSSYLYAVKSQEGTTAIFRRFSYKEMNKATDNFSTNLGRGRHGVVYKGQFDCGATVAVKCIDNFLTQSEGDFCREMELLGRLHHRHIVALKGFCFTSSERLVIHEFMDNGSLKDHLHSSDKPPLTWQTRIQIAIDVANALEYLHFYCDPRLCHGDIKSSSVLLDKNFLAKVADFGLAHYSGSSNIKHHPANMKIQGSPGYVDPEYMTTQVLTAKSDVYSYGVLLLELMTGKLAVHDGRNLADWYREFIASNSPFHEMVDPMMLGLVDTGELRAVTEIVWWCTQKEGGARPSMKQVARMLCKRLDPVHGMFTRAIEDEEGCCYGGGGRASRETEQWSEVIAFGGDGRCLQSSSSTTRSYCSRSLLLTGNSPESPHGDFTV